jgi:hypothetical protein
MARNGEAQARLDAFTVSIPGSWNATPKPFVVRLSGPIRRLISEEESLRIGHFRRKLMHSARCSVLYYTRICELDVSMPGPLLDRGLAPGENCGAIEINVFWRWGFDGCGR